jgi:hypothetical protein
MKRTRKSKAYFPGEGKDCNGELQGIVPREVPELALWF